MLESLLGSSALVLGGITAGSFLFGGAIACRVKRADTEDKLQELVDNLVDGVYRTSLDGCLLKANPAMIALNGYTDHAEGMAAMADLGSHFYVDDERRKEFKNILDSEGRVDNFISEIRRHKTGERIWVSESARLVCGRSGRPLHYEGMVREYTDTMKRLKLEDSYRKYSENVPGVLVQFRWSSEGEFSLPFASRGFRELCGVHPGELTEDASRLFRLLHRDDYLSFAENAENSVSSGTVWQQKFRIMKPGKNETWIELKATPELEADGSCIWHGYLMDVTKEKRFESRIHNLAYYDPLTNLPNRRRMMDQLKLAIDRHASSKKIGAVIFLDLDDFKSVNDTLGHACGDKFLVEMARRLENCVGEEGIVARFAGDEFVILLPDLSSDEKDARLTAHRTARLVNKAMCQSVNVEGQHIQTSCSMGITLFDKSTTLAYEVLRQSDMAMYASKEDGKSQITFYDPQRELQREQSVSLMAELLYAIENNELDLNFQAQVDVEGNVIGAEGLLRWNHPERGMISPDQFIPRAEETGTIIPVTAWLFEEAFKVLSCWKHDPALKDLKLSINISARQFHEPDFVDRITELVDKYEVRPSLLMLEMTEHVLTTDPRQVSKVMGELRQLGICFSLDDFGTCYSSLVQMRDLPFNEVKIDGKFVSDLDRNESDRTLVRSIIAMAKALDLITVAEWVETESQSRFLIEEGCDIQQGYLFGPAMPLEQFERMVSKAASPRLNQPKNGGLVPEQMVASA